MVAVPLGLKSYRRLAALVPEVILKNLWLEKDESGISPDGTIRVQRPGLFLINEFDDPIRGMHVVPSDLTRLTVSGSSLFVEDVEAAYIPGDDLVPMVSTEFGTFMAANGMAFVFADGLFTAISLPEGEAVVDLDQINGYVILLTPSGRFYWLEPGSTIVGALNFATAESSPDGAIAIRRLGDEFWIFGTQTVEPWQPTGDADLPFQRAVGRVYDRGCLHRDTVRRFDNSLVWVGDDLIVYRGGAVPQAISDNGISERLRLRSGDPSAWTFGYDGHKFYVLRIPGQGTFGYDATTAQWSEFASLNESTWLPHVGYEIDGAVVCGSWKTGKIYNFEGSSAQDDFGPMPWAVTGTISVSGKPVRNDSISIGVGASGSTTINVRWRDGQEPYPSEYEVIDVRAPYDLVDVWRLGSPDAPYRTFELSGPSSARVRISGLTANDGWK